MSDVDYSIILLDRITRLVRQLYTDGIYSPPHADRVQKLKDARTEAAKEIEAYKAKREEAFKKFESEVGGMDRSCQ